MGKMSDCVAATLDKIGISYTDVDEGEWLTFELRGENTRFECEYFSDEEQELLTFEATLPLMVPEKRLADMYAWACERNLMLDNGAYLVSRNTASIRYRLVTCVKGGVINEEIIKDALYRSIAEADNDFKEIVRTIFPKEEEE